MTCAPCQLPDVSDMEQRLQQAGLRVTAQRVSLGKLIFAPGCWHFTAEDLWQEAQDHGVEVALATIYNTLNKMVDAGMLNTVEAGGTRAIYDTNLAPHHHAVQPETGQLLDLPADAVRLQVDPSVLPAGTTVDDVQLLVQLRRDGDAADG